MKVYVKGKLINAADGYKFLGEWLDSTLNMNERLRRMLGKVNTKIKLLSRVRHPLTVFATKAVYTSIILPTMLYCSTPVVKILETKTKKFDSIQKEHKK